MTTRVRLELPMIAIYLVVFALGFAADILTVEWHKSREAMKVNRTAALSMALEALTWAPVVLFVMADDPIVALVSILASGAGTRTGLRRIARQQSDAIELATGPDVLACTPSLKHTSGGEGPSAKAGKVIGFRAWIK